MVFEGLRCGGPGHQRAARGTNRNDGWANRRPMPDWRIGRRQVSSSKGQGPARAGAFVSRITSAFIRSRRRPAFRALSLEKKGSGEKIGRASGREGECQYVESSVVGGKVKKK